MLSLIKNMFNSRVTGGGGRGSSAGVKADGQETPIITQPQGAPGDLDLFSPKTISEQQIAQARLNPFHRYKDRLDAIKALFG